MASPPRSPRERPWPLSASRSRPPASNPSVAPFAGGGRSSSPASPSSSSPRTATPPARSCTRTPSGTRSPPRSPPAGGRTSSQRPAPFGPRTPARSVRSLRPLPEPRVDWSGPAVSLREVESPSSLEKLLGCSLLHALTYAGGLWPGRSGTLPDGALLLGSVCHSILERVLARTGFTPDEAAEEAERLFDTTGPFLGASLFLPGAERDRAVARRAVRDAARHLVGLAARLGVSKVEVERALEAPWPGGTVRGRADLVFTSPSAVVDLKWSKGIRRDLLRNGGALQLAAYARLLAHEDGLRGLPPVAYYILRDAVLLAQSERDFPGAEAVGGPPPRDVWAAVESAALAARERLARGELVSPGREQDEDAAAGPDRRGPLRPRTVQVLRPRSPLWPGLPCGGGMKPVEVISASAGSGKTSRLAKHLAAEIGEGRVRPEAVVAVTFTVKAAAELARRVREELLRHGKVDEARRLGAARIGTVHSVCGRLLSDFAFDLGLSPDLTVLDQESAAAALKRSLSSVVTREDEESLSELQSLFPDLDLEEAARKIQEAARSNGIDAATLDAFGEASVAELTNLLDGCGREIDGARWDADLVAALDAFLASVDLDLDTTKATKDACTRVRTALAALRGTRRPAWQVFTGLANLETGKKSRDLAAPVQALAADHDRHPRFRSDLARATRLAFSLAARSLSAYADYKRERGVVDFADQEALALRLLERPAVREQLEAEIDLVLVDEFQDTSPLQLALFLSLARLAKSAWVGDQKQAIYGFRGTDPALMDAAIESLLGGASRRRSRSPGAAGPRSSTSPPSSSSAPSAGRGSPRPASASFRESPTSRRVSARSSSGGRSARRTRPGDAAETAARVRALLEDPETRVRDRATGEVRRPRPGDVAVLCRMNEECADDRRRARRGGPRIDPSPRRGRPLPRGPSPRRGPPPLGRPPATPSPPRPSPGSSSARTTPTPGSPRRSALPAPRPSASSPPSSRVRAAREASPLLGPEAALDAVLDALDLRELCLSWGSAASRLASLEELRAAAVAFTGRALAEGRPATVLGFLDSLDEAVKPEQRPESPDAVVVSTLHGAKGLEWPIVVLDLHPDTREPSVFGVNVLSEAPIDLDHPLAGRRIAFWPGALLGPDVAHPHPRPPRLERAQAPPRRAGRPREPPAPLRRLHPRPRPRRPRCARRQARPTPSSATSAPPSTTTARTSPSAGSASRRTAVPRRRRSRRARPARPARPRSPPARASTRPRSSRPRRSRRRAPRASRSPSARAFPCAPAPTCSSSETPSTASSPRTARRSHDPTVSPSPSPSSPAGASPARSLPSPSSTPPTPSRRSSRHAGLSATWHRELPVRRRLPDGSVLSGTADLVLETPEGLVVVDHKSYPGSTAEALARAAKHAGQLAAYAETVAEAWGKPVLGTFIHLPVGGIVVPVMPAP